MRPAPLLLIVLAASQLGACAAGGLNRGRPDEFAVARNPQLVIPPDYAMTPPGPGQADAGADPRGQALQAIFGGPQPRSAVENNLLQMAGAETSAMGARSVAGDPETRVVNRGELVQTIMALPQGDGQEASVQVPQ